MQGKAAYVVRQKSDGKHTCHWPGCGKVVPPAMWGCKTHRFKLPANLRAMIWQAYRPGQEIDKNPSAEYMKAAQLVEEWIATQETP